MTWRTRASVLAAPAALVLLYGISTGCKGGGKKFLPLSTRELLKKDEDGVRDFSRADLEGADLKDADLKDADLKDADLSDTNLARANLIEVADKK